MPTTMRGAMSSPRPHADRNEAIERHPVHVLLDEDDLFAVEPRCREPERRSGDGSSRRPRLVAEHLDEVRVFGELRVQALGRHDAAEAVVADEARDVDRRHAARARSACRERSARWCGARRSRGARRLAGRFHSSTAVSLVAPVRSFEELDRRTVTPEVDVLETCRRRRWPCPRPTWSSCDSWPRSPTTRPGRGSGPAGSRSSAGATPA